MAEAVTAKWHGDNYQARIFWENALNLLDPSSCVVEVTFEANGPKAFDDVVVKYDPPVPRSGPGRVEAEYHQVKWHVTLGGRFGYKDFVDPEFIGASAVSLLQRLQAARRGAPGAARFAFLTTYRILDGDPLSFLVSGVDKALMVERLFDGTTDRSKNGKVRKLWREHLQLSSDAELKSVVDGLRILEGHRSLDELRTEINLKARVVGLLACDATKSDFRYDELARQLKVRKLNSLTRDTLATIVRDEGLGTVGRPEPDNFRPLAIRSFLGPAADIAGASPNDTLMLTDDFRQRYLQDGREWQRDIRPRVQAFLLGAVTKSSQIRLILDAHASIAFLAGSVLDMKSGVEVQLVQKGRVGSRVWLADDGTVGPNLTVRTAKMGEGADLAVAIGMSQAVDAQVVSYLANNLPKIGQMMAFMPPDGPSHKAVMGGAHAATLAGGVANAVRDWRQVDTDATVHIFAACPNSVLFYLGQHHQGLGPCIVYEFDFDRRGNKTYHPSFVME